MVHLNQRTKKQGSKNSRGRDNRRRVASFSNKMKQQHNRWHELMAHKDKQNKGDRQNKEDQQNKGDQQKKP